MARQTAPPLPPPKNWPQKVRSAASPPAKSVVERTQISDFTFGGLLHQVALTFRLTGIRTLAAETAE